MGRFEVLNDTREDSKGKNPGQTENIRNEETVQDRREEELYKGQSSKEINKQDDIKIHDETTRKEQFQGEIAEDRLEPLKSKTSNSHSEMTEKIIEEKGISKEYSKQLTPELIKEIKPEEARRLNELNEKIEKHSTNFRKENVEIIEKNKIYKDLSTAIDERNKILFKAEERADKTKTIPLNTPEKGERGALIVNREKYEQTLKENPHLKNAVENLKQNGLVKVNENKVIFTIPEHSLVHLKNQGLVKSENQNLVIIPDKVEKSLDIRPTNEALELANNSLKNRELKINNDKDFNKNEVEHRYNLLKDIRITMNVLAGDRSSLHNYEKLIYDKIERKDTLENKIFSKEKTYDLKYKDFENLNKNKNTYQYNPTDEIRKTIEKEEKEQGRIPEKTRDKEVNINRSMAESMYEIGKFRVIEKEDLRKGMYQGSERKMMNDIRKLSEQGLIKRNVVFVNEEKLEVFSLTTKGKDFVENTLKPNPKQQIYSGIAKSERELKHDTGIYKMYLKEAEKIQKEGGKVDKVSLDYELKSKGEGVIIAGKTVIPDLQIEYTDREQNKGKIDLEVVSDNYRNGMIGEKAQAGFSLYADAGSVARVSKILEQQNLANEVFSL